MTGASVKGRTVDSPRLAAGLFADLVSPAQAVEAEHFVVVAMDGRGVVIDAAVLTIGDVSCCIVSPPQVLRWALTRERPARSFLVMHNHPSGDPAPSGEDLHVTRRLHEAARAVGLPFVDHVVVAFANGIVYRSLSADGHIPLDHTWERMVAKDGPRPAFTLRGGLAREARILAAMAREWGGRYRIPVDFKPREPARYDGQRIVSGS